jgi:hypothetical protein
MSSAEHSDICSGKESTPDIKDLIGAGAVNVIPEMAVDWAAWSKMSDEEVIAAWDMLSDRQQNAAWSIVRWLERRFLERKSVDVCTWCGEDYYCSCEGCPRCVTGCRGNCRHDDD